MIDEQLESITIGDNLFEFKGIDWEDPNPASYYFFDYTVSSKSIEEVNKENQQ